MNYLILVLLLLCCGNGSGAQSDCGCQNRQADRGFRDRNEREHDCGCRNDSRQESRLEPRTFISYPNPNSSSNCGCEESRNNNGCDCGG
ncbi:MAG: hypothetical protein NC429_01060 [Lachnospiraceae bacterium]|nr:hypothetical protein [Lachnospiraceae bacterium]